MPRTYSQLKWTHVLQILIFLLSLISRTNAVSLPVSRKTSTSPLGITIGVILLFTCILCCCCLAYCVWRELPTKDNFFDPIEFSPLELEAVRLSRQEEKEERLREKIFNYKKQLDIHRRRKTEMQTRKDLLETLDDKVDKFHAKGRSIYGMAWDVAADDSVPLKEVASVGDEELRKLRIEAQNIVTSRKAEEERDLWSLWYDEEQGETKEKIAGKDYEEKDEEVREVDVLSGRATRTSAITKQVKQKAVFVDPRFMSGPPDKIRTERRASLNPFVSTPSNTLSQFNSDRGQRLGLGNRLEEKIRGPAEDVYPRPSSVSGPGPGRKPPPPPPYPPPAHLRETTPRKETRLTASGSVVSRRSNSREHKRQDDENENENENDDIQNTEEKSLLHTHHA